MSKLEGVLKDLTKFDGVIGALVLDSGSRAVAKSIGDTVDSKALVEALESGLVEGGRVARALGKGEMDRQQVQYEGDVILVESLSGGGLLALLLAPGANQGRVRLEIRKNKAAVETAIAG